METFLLSLWTLPAAWLQFSQVQFTFMMLFKSITYIQHAQKNFLKASCLHLCSNYLWSNLSLTCKRSLCWPQWDQESLKLLAAAWFFQKLKSWWHLMHVCYRTHIVSPFSISWTNFTIYYLMKQLFFFPMNILQCICQDCVFALIFLHTSGWRLTE